MMRSLSAPYGATISLDFRKQFGDRVELDCFQFVIPPVEFRLVRNSKPLQWTANSDGRQAVFSKRAKQRRYTATFIDQGYCFNAGEWDFPDSPLRGVYARNCVYQHVTGWESFEPAITKAEQADPVDLWRCAEATPPEWYGQDHDALSRVVESLYKRRSIIRDLINAFRESTRCPFPNWTEN